MALREVVIYVSSICMMKTTNLYALAEHYGWEQEDVLAFLRSEREPSKKMLREMAAALDLKAEYLTAMLRR
jgi:hypothetical protein